MRHRISDKKFNRDTDERKALLMGLLRNLTERGEIVTTRARAKVVQRLADKMITQAKDNSLASRHVLHRTFGKREVVNTLVDRIAPAMSGRNSGYTRIIVLGARRGDNTDMVKLSFVDSFENKGTLNSGKEYAEKVEKKEKATKVVEPKTKVAEPKTKKKSTK